MGFVMGISHHIVSHFLMPTGLFFPFHIRQRKVPYKGFLIGGGLSVSAGGSLFCHSCVTTLHASFLISYPISLYLSQDR